MKWRVVGLFAVALFCAPSLVHADPVTVTSGGWFAVFDGDCGAIQLGAATFTVTSHEVCYPFQGPLNPGTSFAVTRTLTGNMTLDTDGTVNGVTYPFGSLSLNGTTLQFTGDPITVPAAAPLNTFAHFDVPFTMTGNLVVTRWADSTPVLSTAVTGRGQFGVTLESEGGQWGLPLFDASYRFSETPAATPEPASLLLLGSGLAGIALRRARNKKRDP